MTREQQQDLAECLRLAREDLLAIRQLIYVPAVSSDKLTRVLELTINADRNIEMALNIHRAGK